MCTLHTCTAHTHIASSRELHNRRVCVCVCVVLLSQNTSPLGNCIHCAQKGRRRQRWPQLQIAPIKIPTAATERTNKNPKYSTPGPMYPCFPPILPPVARLRPPYLNAFGGLCFIYKTLARATKHTNEHNNTAAMAVGWGRD